MRTKTDIRSRRAKTPAPVAAKQAAAKPTAVYVVLYDGILMLDLAGIAEPYRIANRWAREQGRPEPFALRYVAEREWVDTSLGLRLERHEPLPDVLPADAWLIVPGAAGSLGALDRPATRRVVTWLRKVGAQPARRITVCSGALLAGLAGWLDGLECTTHHDLVDALRRAAPRAKVVDNRIFVDNGSVATSAGITAGIDLALWTIGQVLGPLGALAVARDLLIFARRGGDDPQISPWLKHRNHLHPAVHRAQDAVAQAPAQPWTMRRLAAVAHVGERHLNRLFVTQTGITPRDYVQGLRLALARNLLAQSQCSVEHAAAAAGFSSAHHLRRAWRREWDQSPREAAA